MFSIEFKKKAVKDLDKIPQKDNIKIRSEISKLKENPLPDGVKKLKAREFYRIRQENYRIVYSVSFNGKIITIEAIKHRKDIYQALSFIFNL